MEERKKNKLLPDFGNLRLIVFFLIIGLTALVLLIYFSPEFLQSKVSDERGELNEQVDESEIVNGIHIKTGLVAGEGLTAVINNCTNCHSAKLVTQNRATKEGWTQVIRWMQETQNLWELGEHEEVIVSYLSTHYAPEAKGRRKPLDVEWYELK